MARKRRTKKQYEARLIQLLRKRFEKAKLEVEDHLKVGRLPLEIDMVTRQGDESRQTDIPALFEYFRQHNVIEIKTEVDPLKIDDLLKLQAYAWLYMVKEGIYSVSDVTATALVHHIPQSVAEALPALGYQPVGEGIYRRDGEPISYLISFDDAPDEMVPEELQVFSNAVRRIRLFAQYYGEPENQELIDAIIDLYESEVIKLMALYNVREESIPKFVDALGRKKVIAAFSKEERLAGLSKEELMAVLSKEELMAALSKEELMAALGGKEKLLQTLLAELSPEQLQKLLAEIGSN